MRYQAISWLSDVSRNMLAVPMMILITASAAGSQSQNTPLPSTLVIGHQGAAGLLPGNTLAGFARAIALGVDAIELDTLITADGIVVVHHDFTLDPDRTRTADGRWLTDSGRIPIKDLTLEQLQTYDVGRLKPGSRAARSAPDQAAVDGQKIPTLKEVLELVNDSGAAGPDLYIEIKSSPEKNDDSPSPRVLADKVVELLEEHGLADRCKILSFDWRALARINTSAPSIATVHLTSRYKQFKTSDKETTLLWTAGVDPDVYQRSLPAMIKAAGGRYWGAKHSEIWRSDVKAAHQAGLKIYVWTVDSESDMRHFLDIGIDGIITNRPDVLKDVVANAKRSVNTK